SKSLGNVVDPSDIVDEYGADVLRFYMLWVTVPWEDLRFSVDGLETINRMCNIFWNTYLFTDTYMKLDNFDPEREYEIELRVEDRWIISKYNSLILNVDESMGNLHLHEVCHLLKDFILELSRWYIKLVRDRVWLEGEKPEKISVYTTLHEVLCGLCRLMAPVMPHLSEDIYVNLTGERSVHLTWWPTPDKDLIDRNLEDCMGVAQQIVEGVASARQTAAIKLRWPIPKIIVAPSGELNLKEVEDIILKAGNAKSLEVRKMETETTVRPNYSSLGPKYRGEVESIVEKLKTVDAEKILRGIREKGSYMLGKFTLCDDDLIFETRLPQDIVAQEFDKGIIYIESKLDEKLFSEAMAREVIRRIQEMRKDLQLNEMDKIKVYVDCDSGFKGYIKENMEFIGHEIRGSIFFGKGRGFEREWRIEDNKINIAVELAAGSSE
ncbi:MAG: class I tRNA ligase family protein, partial [Candidatus Altiarchaeales archaeon]|nr:class I tRNA ligase family protein [Candidatus Altiarchaeales archaeon]